MVALLASVRFLSELGLPDIDVWTSHLTALAIDDLRARGFEVITPDDPALRGPIVTFRVPGADLAQANATAAAYLDALNARTSASPGISTRRAGRTSAFRRTATTPRTRFCARAQ